MKAKTLPAVLATVLIFVAVIGCGRKADSDSGNLEIGIGDDTVLPEEFSENESSEPGAREMVQASLFEKGVRPGFDMETGRIVVVANASAHCLNPHSDKRFFDLRTECLDIALKNARRKMLESMRMNMSADNSKGEDIAVAGDPSAEMIVSSVNGVLAGAIVVESAESWGNGKYEIAVAAVVAEKLTRDITDRIAGKTVENGKPGKYTLGEWLDAQNLSIMLGPRTFVDNTGVRHYLGIGAADAEAATDAALKIAQTKAQAKAAKFAAFSFPTRIHSKITVRQVAAGDEDLEEEYTEEPEAEPREVRIVLQTEAVHPLSGRKMSVVVAEAIP